MIRRHNQKEVMLGLACILLSLVGYACAYLFFRYLPQLTCHLFGLEIPPTLLTLASFGILILITIAGYLRWKNQGGFYSYYDSAIYHDLDGSTGGANVVDLYAHRVTGPAYLLGQIFLAGPLKLLHAITHFRNRVPPSPIKEKSLAALLEKLQKINRWEGFSAHPGEEESILLLAKMGKIDFSDTRGPRFRAYPPDFQSQSDSPIEHPTNQ